MLQGLLGCQELDAPTRRLGLSGRPGRFGLETPFLLQGCLGRCPLETFTLQLGLLGCRQLGRLTLSFESPFERNPLALELQTLLLHGDRRRAYK